MVIAKESKAWYLFVAVVVVGSFVGVWHALPLLNVINDEMYFVGGVLRAMQHHTLIPLLYDVPYGTLTFYVNFIFYIPFLALLFLLSGLDLPSVVATLTLHPEYGYFLTRCVSAILAVGAFFWLARFLKSKGVSPLARAAALSVPFMSILPAALLHTGKVWVLSTLLGAVSFCFLYAAWSGSDERESKRNARWGIVLAFVAFANFPLAGVFLVAALLLALRFRRSYPMLRSLAASTGWGVLVFSIFTALNYRNVLFQVTDIFTRYHPLAANVVEHTSHLTFVESLLVHAHGVVLLYPLVLAVLLIAYVRGAVQNRTLFYLSGVYAGVYFIALSVVVNWTFAATDSLRYLFPLAFFFGLMIAALDFSKMRTVLWGLLTINVIVYGYTLYLLAVPTTLNQASEYVVRAYGQDPQVLVGIVPSDLDVPVNAASAALTRDEFCGSKCHYLRSSSTTQEFLPTVINEETKEGVVQTDRYKSFVWVDEMLHRATCQGSPLATFGNALPDGEGFEVDYGLGNYLAPAFWTLKRLGKNIYMYEVSRSCFDTLLQVSASTTVGQAR